MPHDITIESIQAITEGDEHKKCRISWSVRWKSAQQSVTVYPDEDVEKIIFKEEVSKRHCYETLYQPGFQYKATITSKSACCVPLKSRTFTFLTEGIYKNLL